MKAFFKAMDDPTRRQILEMLRGGSLTAGEIAEAFDMTKPSISYHLDLLSQADLVLAVKKGKYVYYSLNTTVLDDIIQWLIQLNQKPKS